VFEGLITLVDPAKSWVAKWQRLDGYVRGVYATKVSGQLPDDVRTTLEEEYRITYIPYVAFFLFVNFGLPPVEDGVADVLLDAMAARRRRISIQRACVLGQG
jgi:hypothetical protein